MTARVSQQLIVVPFKTSPNARVTQLVMEVITTNDTLAVPRAAPIVVVIGG